jgi:hypothetical protein
MTTPINLSCLANSTNPTDQVFYSLASFSQTYKTIGISRNGFHLLMSRTAAWSYVESIDDDTFHIFDMTVHILDYLEPGQYITDENLLILL